MNYCDTIALEIDGKVIDDQIIELTETDEVPTKAVNTMNRRRRASGYKSGNRTFSLSLKVEVASGPDAVDWHGLVSGRKEFTIRRTKSNEEVTTWSRCRATKVDESQSDGDSTGSVSVVALDRNP